MTLWIRYALAALVLLVPLTRGADAQAPGLVFPKSELWIVSGDKRHHFTIEFADNDERRMTGLMFRPRMAADAGMLFDFKRDAPVSMWMKNTLVSLDMVFIDADGTIKTIAERTVPHSLATVSSNVPVRATLELAAGVTEKLNIRVGDKVRHKLFGTAP